MSKKRWVWCSLCCLGLGMSYYFSVARAADDNPCSNYSTAEANKKCAYIYNDSSGDELTSPPGLKQTQDNFIRTYSIEIPPQSIQSPAGLPPAASAGIGGSYNTPPAPIEAGKTTGEPIARPPIPGETNTSSTTGGETTPQHRNIYQ